jgi:type IV secretory pathway VirB2 component (pilin)
MQTLNKILDFLDGRKAKILGIVSVVIGYMTATGAMSADLATAILAVLNIIAGGAAMATDKTLGFRKRSKVEDKSAGIW